MEQAGGMNGWGRIDGRLDQMDGRLDRIDQRLSRVEGHLFGVEFPEEPEG